MKLAKRVKSNQTVDQVGWSSSNTNEAFEKYIGHSMGYGYRIFKEKEPFDLDIISHYNIVNCVIYPFNNCIYYDIWQQMLICYIKNMVT